MTCGGLVEFVLGVLIATAVLIPMSLEVIKRRNIADKKKDKELKRVLAELEEKTKAIQELIKGVHHEGPNENLKRIRALLGLYLMDSNINYLKQAVEEAKKAEDKILNHVNKYSHLQ